MNKHQVNLGHHVCSSKQGQKHEWNGTKKEEKEKERTAAKLLTVMLPRTGQGQSWRRKSRRKGRIMVPNLY